MPAPLQLWWPALVLGGIMTLLALATMPSSVEAVTDWRLSLVVAMVGEALVAAGAMSFAWVVAEIDDRQYLRAMRIGPDRAVDGPGGPGAAGTPEGAAGAAGANGADGAEDDSPVPAGMRAAEGPTWGRY